MPTSNRRQRPTPPNLAYRDFVQRVRAHRPTDLLPILAKISAAESERRLVDRDWRTAPLGLYPWIIAVIARESIAYGSEHRAKPVTDRALTRMASAYMELRDPWRTDDSEESLSDFLIRTAYEQFPWNEPLYNEMAHVVALLDRDFSRLGCEVLQSSSWVDLLGAELVDLVGAAFLFGTSTWKNDGRMDLGWLAQDNFGPVVAELPAAKIHLLWRSFSAPFENIRARARDNRNPDEDLRRLDWNPLQSAPFVGMLDGSWIAPQAMYVHQRASLSTVYHLGQERWGDAFTRDLGLVMQAYVGEQFNLMHPEGVLPDVEYRPSQRAVDFVIVLPDIVLLVEVKSARVAVPGRLNLGSFVRDVERDVGKAFRQISHTSRLITDGHQAFASVPPNRPLRGAVITAEPHHLINATAIRANLPQPAVPTVVLGLGEFEELIEECASRPGPHWLAVTDIPANDAASVRRYLSDARRKWQGTVRPRNSILDAAWSRLPFRDAT